MVPEGRTLPSTTEGAQDAVGRPQAGRAPRVFAMWSFQGSRAGTTNVHLTPYPGFSLFSIGESRAIL